MERKFSDDEGWLGRRGAYSLRCFGSIFLCSFRMNAALSDSLIGVLDFDLAYSQTAGSSGRISHLRASTGRFWWNDCEAVWTPSSAFILWEISWAELTALGVRQYWIASVRLVSLSDL